MINENFDILAGILALVGSMVYAWVTFQGKARPNLVSWGLWTVIPAITFAAELAQHVHLEVGLLTLSEAVGPLLVVLAALANRQAFWKITRFDIYCSVIAMLAVVLWLITGQGNIAIIFSLIAALFSAIPTILKAYSFPATESPSDYVLSLIAGIITILTIKQWTLGNYGFPIYITLESAVISFFILTPQRVKKPAGTNPVATQTSQPPATPLPAPVNLTSPTPSQIPALNWPPVPGAESYNVYRDDAKITSTTDTLYTDATAKSRTYHYHITAVAQGHESPGSNEIEVVVDHLPPQVSFNLNPQPNEAGWHNSPVTITFVGHDDVAGIATCTPPITLSLDCASQTSEGHAMNFAGESASVSVTLKIDQSPPELGEPVWTGNPAKRGENATLSVPVVDHLSGVKAGEYFDRDDPGPGKGTPMRLNADMLEVTLKTDLEPGTYSLHIRAVDAAGNWSEPVATALRVREPEAAAAEAPGATA